MKLKDMKEALGSGRKPDITHMRLSMIVYGSRACEYGSDKYERSNYLRPNSGVLDADFNRFRGYLRACVSHVMHTLDAMELHQAGDPELKDEDGMMVAAYAADLDPCDKVGPSCLPHLCGAVASLNMAIEQATRSGLLPKDPGQPWKGLVAGRNYVATEDPCDAPIAGHPPIDDADDDVDDDHAETCVHRVPMSEPCKYCEL
jgi:hypothetical protein